MNNQLSLQSDAKIYGNIGENCTNCSKIDSSNVITSLDYKNGNSLYPGFLNSPTLLNGYIPYQSSSLVNLTILPTTLVPIYIQNVLISPSYSFVQQTVPVTNFYQSDNKKILVPSFNPQIPIQSNIIPQNQQLNIMQSNNCNNMNGQNITTPMNFVFNNQNNSGNFVLQVSTNKPNTEPSTSFQVPLMKPNFIAQVSEKDDVEEGSSLINKSTDHQSTGKQLFKLTRLGILGSSLGEKVSSHHKHRPCFKKIDSLCGRIKQDILKTDLVLANINSQGFSWAIKDLIFVFTRILNAWIIIKGYAYCKPEGSLKKLKNSMSPDFMQTFTTWQAATIDFLQAVICSFVNLDLLLQKEMALFKNETTEEQNNLSNESNASFTSQSSAASTSSSSGKFVNEFEQQHQQQNHEINYLNDGISSAIKLLLNNDDWKTNPNFYKEILASMSMNNKDNGMKINQNGIEVEEKVNKTNNLEDEMLKEYRSLIVNAPNPERKSEHQYFKSGIYEIPILNNKFGSGLQAEVIKECNIVTQINSTKSPEMCSTCNKSLFAKDVNSNLDCNLPHNLLASYYRRTYSRESAIPKKDHQFMFDKLTDELLSLYPEYFFEKDNLKQQFPNFAKHYGAFFPSTREMVIKISLNNYKSIYDVIHDLRTIIYFSKVYLSNFSDEGLKSYLNYFETTINNVLKGDTFNKYTFEHIKGEPGEEYEARLFYEEG